MSLQEGFIVFVTMANIIMPIFGIGVNRIGCALGWSCALIYYVQLHNLIK